MILKVCFSVDERAIIHYLRFCDYREICRSDGPGASAGGYSDHPSQSDDAYTSQYVFFSILIWWAVKLKLIFRISCYH